MDRLPADSLPSQEWLASVNATCNRLSAQYLQLFKAASSMPALEPGVADPRSGGGQWTNSAPPPPLAADVTRSALTCQLAVENLCVAASQLLSLIRTLRLSILLMDESSIVAEEEWQVHQALKLASEHLQVAAKLEQEWINLRTAPPVEE